MSSAGRAANSNGCVAKPKEHATGLIGFAAQIRRSSLIGSCAMETAEHREPCESRGSRTDLGAPGGEIPPGDSTRTGNFTRTCASRVKNCVLTNGNWRRLVIISVSVNGKHEFGYPPLPRIWAGPFAFGSSGK